MEVAGSEGVEEVSGGAAASVSASASALLMMEVSSGRLSSGA